ncbi:MAG: hypothetical protein NW241_16280 [Bacteroidia bacterium]|nr:hypothetical protein [Bacteroidia bacterium]
MFLASAWAPGGEPRVLLAGWSGLLEVDTAGVSRQRITISSQRRTHFFNGVQWNP